MAHEPQFLNSVFVLHSFPFLPHIIEERREVNDRNTNVQIWKFYADIIKVCIAYRKGAPNKNIIQTAVTGIHNATNIEMNITVPGGVGAAFSLQQQSL